MDLFLSTNAFKLQRVKRSRLFSDLKKNEDKNIRRIIICFVSGAYLEVLHKKTTMMLLRTINTFCSARRKGNDLYISHRHGCEKTPL